MEIRWFKGTDCIYLYKNGHVTVREDYEGRVSVNTLELQRGDASLTLRVSREEDKGLYTCQVISGEHKEEGRVRLLPRSKLFLFLCYEELSGVIHAAQTSILYTYTLSRLLF